MNNSTDLIVDALKKYNTFSILPHINPDADTIGSCFAIKHILEKMGKSAVIYLSDTLPKHLSFINGEYQVFDKVQKCDVCICIDCGDIGRIDGREAVFNASDIKINIDHHYANTRYADINLVDADACSAGEICYNLIKKLGVDFDKTVAEYIYCAMCADTGGLKYSNTTPKAMRIAADLLEYEIDSARINKLLFDTESYDIMRLKGEITNKVELYCDGAVGVVYVRYDMLDKYGIGEKEIDNIVDIARRIDGVEVAVSVKECSASTKISLRSNEYIDVSKIAETFGGGGHVRASGFIIKDDFETAKQKVIDEVIKTVKEYKK